MSDPHPPHSIPAQPQMALTTPLALVPGVPPNLAEAMAMMGVTNVGRFLAHLPLRHEIQEAESAIGEIVAGRIVSARGEVTATKVWPRGPKPRLEAVLHDGTGRLEVLWFNMMYLREKIKPGVRLRVQGKATKRGSGVQLVNPRHEVLHPGNEDPPPRDSRVRPVYPASELIRAWQVEKLAALVLPMAWPLLEDHLTPEYRAARSLPSLGEAYRMMHAPESTDEVLMGRRRLAYDELLLLQLGVHMKRWHLRRSLRAPDLRWNEAVDKEIKGRFPFALTASQETVVREIAADLSKPTPTNRLVQGDVGSGKTVVALYAMLMAVMSKHQAALMAPTEILAEQHFQSVKRMLSGGGVRVELLTGGMEPATRARIIAGLGSGSVDIVIGTHALLTEDVRFQSLAVCVIDEQHRFGVHQRAGLRAKGGGGGGETGITPHVVVMTATPIPRTLAITLFGDLDISVIDGMPPGRKPVRTRVIDAAERHTVYQEVRKRLDAGEQAFVVVPAIGEEDDERMGVEPTADGELVSARSLVRELEAGAFAGKRVAAMHSRLRKATRDSIMERFRAGLIDALVATTVIEVGVDIPGATVMVVEHAERFGLAQLHQ
ncbi:MAG: ATP-dependent DNA helicase RecG, partial [Planctomycetota bacterium]